MHINTFSFHLFFFLFDKIKDFFYIQFLCLNLINTIIYANNINIDNNLRLILKHTYTQQILLDSFVVYIGKSYKYVVLEFQIKSQNISITKNRRHFLFVYQHLQEFSGDQFGTQMTDLKLL